MVLFMSHDTPINRRTLLGSSVAAAGGLSLAGCAPATHADAASVEPLVQPGDVVLFQGDSITDADRSRDTANTANQRSGMGKGYAWLAAAGLLLERDRDRPADQPQADGLQIYNRGISGNKVHQLNERWQEDCLDLQPDVLSILIGVNDIWHTKGGNYDGTVAIYERDYDQLLTRTREALPQIKLVICEPFVLRCGAVKDDWFPEFDEYRAAARRVADKHGATWVGFQAMFDDAVAYAPPKHWAEDGVHPSSAGAAVMAQTWLDAVSGGTA